ncbi:hypothetical protein PWT90_11231 [Aphanocladium album]|nr:hypothetical protein PWT90_11231 [Aphanocladium album]
MDSTTAERTYTDEELDREWQPTSRRPLSIPILPPTPCGEGQVAALPFCYYIRFFPVIVLLLLLPPSIINSSTHPFVENAPILTSGAATHTHTSNIISNKQRTPTTTSTTMDQSQKQQRRLTINSEDRTVARSFSDELMNIFRIDNSVADLDQQVDSR